MNDFPIEQLSPLTLGTAQIGLKYGIANRANQPDKSEAFAIMDSAWALGVRCFDTARAYGDSEDRIGAWMADGRRPLLVSKMPPLKTVEKADPGVTLHRHFAKSCEALSVEHLDGYLVHRAEDFFLPEIREELENLKCDGRIRSYGVSAYGADEILRVLDVGGTSFVQIPINVLDTKMRNSGVLERCAEAGITVFARSVFLQGALLMEAESLPEFLSVLKTPINLLDQLSREAGLSRAALLMAAVRSLPAIASLVIGVDNVAQLQEIAGVSNRYLPSKEIVDRVWEAGMNIPYNIIDPRQWPSV